MMKTLPKYKIYIVSVVILAITSIVSFTSEAQNLKKPELKSVISSIEYFNDENSDKNTAMIAEKLYKQYLKANNLEKFAKYSDVYAKKIPIGPKNSQDIFIISQVMEPPVGCYAKGCATFIYRSTNGKSWSTVFSGHIRSLWYDKNSIKDNKPANLIASSEVNNKNPGVWIWNNSQYFLANRKN